MPEYILTKRSRSDLKQIARYTDQKWGIKKRHEYLALLESAFQKLAENPNFGRTCPELKGTPFRYHVGRHYIF
jgi:toxin ParE1/3/4